MVTLAALPWAAIITALLGFFFSKKAGLSDGEAIAVGAAAGTAGYYLYDPTNPDNLFKVGTAGDTDVTVDPTTDQQSVGDSTGWGDVVTTATTSAGDVLESWGPTGTAAVIATTAAVTNDELMDMLPWLIGGTIAALTLFSMS